MRFESIQEIIEKQPKLVLAAGHKECFEPSGNVKTLIKKNLNSKELQFYSENCEDTSIFRGVIPIVYSISAKERRVELENITYGMKHPIVIDIKIGTHYFTGIHQARGPGFLKSMPTKLLTDYADIIYGARKMGWKVQGCSWLKSLDRKGIHSKKNLNDFMKKINLNPDQIRSIYAQLENMRRTLEKCNYGFIRSSILMAADCNGEPIVKLIDFSNAFKFKNEAQKQKSPYSKGSITGIENLKKVFLQKLK